MCQSNANSRTIGSCSTDLRCHNLPATSILTGFAAIAIFCISTAFAATWVTVSFTEISGSALTFVTFATASVLFLVLRLGRLRQIADVIRQHVRDVLLLNFFTMFAWWFMFMALQMIEASVESAIYMGWIPITVLGWSLVGKRARTLNLRVVGPLLIAFLMFLLVAARFRDGGAIDVAPGHLALGIGFASIAGISGGFYVALSGRFHAQTKCTTLDMLCMRFWLLLLVTGWLGRARISHTILFDPDTLVALLLLSLVSVVIPVFTLQLAIEKLGAARVSITIPLVPPLALGAELVIYGWSTFLVPALVLAISGAIVLANISMRARPADLLAK